jgi:hypothetical protein
MRIITQAGMTVILFMLFSNPTISQNQQQRQKLNELSLKFESDFAIRKAEAIRLADSLGIPVRYESDGQTVELMFFENGMPVYNTTFNAGGAALINSDKIYPGGGAGLSLTGSGQTLGIWDGGKVLNTHQEFGGRVTQVDGATSVSNHATHVAGTMIATGVNSMAKGMSYASTLNAHDWNSDDSEMTTAALGGLKVSQHSYGFITGWAFGSWSGNEDWHWFGDPAINATEDYGFGFYSAAVNVWDQIANNAPNYLIVKSAGNDRGEGPAPGAFHYYWNGSTWIGSSAIRELDGGLDGYGSIPYRGNAKNILTVGAVDYLGLMSSFSSWGPTDDGRVKPDVVAKGVFVYSSVGPGNTNYSHSSGTSMSGPMVSGSTGLLLQHQQNLNPGEDLLSSTVKGLIIHSADDNISGAPGPDYRFGWGLIDTEKAADIMSQNKLADDIHIHELTLNNGNQITIPVKATGDEPLRATLVWNDVPGTPPPASLNPATLMLVNDLDLRILDAGSNTIFPYILNPASPASAATTGDNFRDNVEMVHIASPVAGEVYSVRISHKGTLSGGNQQFSLIITGNEPVSAVSNPPSLTATAISGSQIDLIWTKNIDNNNVMLAWSANGTFGVPVNGTVYSAGQTLPGGGTVLYRGSNTSFMHTGLDANTTYYYKAFSYNASNIYSPGRNANATTDCGTVNVLPFSENFNASTSLPPCWEIDDHIGNGQVWLFGTHTFGLVGTSGNYAFLNSDAYGSGNSQNSDLVTPMMDLTNYTDVTLGFTHYFLNWTGSSGNLFYSINDGASWTQLQTWAYFTSNPAFFSQVIPQVAGQSQVRFKWNYTGAWGYFWDVDDISVTGIETVPVNLTLSGVSIPSGTHCFNATQTITTGGGGQQFVVASGGDVDLIAGQNIIMLPGTHFHSGSAVHALILPGGPYCPVLASSLITEDLNEMKIQENLIASGKENFFRVFPNPATESFTLELESYDDQEVIIIEIYSIMGKRMLNRELPAGLRHYVGLEDFNPGIYLVRVMQGKQTGVERVIKQH